MTQRWNNERNQAPSQGSSRIVDLGSLNADPAIRTQRLPQPVQTLHGEGFTAVGAAMATTRKGIQASGLDAAAVYAKLNG